MKNGYIIVIGTSAGGNLVLPELLKQFDERMNVAIFVVIHLSKKSIAELLVKRIQKSTAVICKIPNHREAIKRNCIYIAPADQHMLIKENEILLGNGPLENRYRPSIDALFRSAAASYGNRVIGIVLTGMLEDGAAGMSAIKSSGGTCIVQNPDEAKYPAMPLAVIDTVKPHYTIPVDEMGTVVNKVLKKPTRRKVKIPFELKKEAEIAEQVYIGIEPLKEIGTHSLFSCPDCGGGLWEIKGGDTPHYRCHVGHSYSEQGLISGMEASTETALWTAIRILEERRNLLRKIGSKELNNTTKKMMRSYHERAKELEMHITRLKDMLFNIMRDNTVNA